MELIQNLSRDELLKLIEVYAKNWLAHDGCWFLAAEEKYDLDTAMELDTKSWERFAVSEARRIMKAFDIPQNGGLKALEKAFQYRLYAAINQQKIEWVDDHTIIFRMIECRVQKTRRQKNYRISPVNRWALLNSVNSRKLLIRVSKHDASPVRRIRLTIIIAHGNSLFNQNRDNRYNLKAGIHNGTPAFLISDSLH